jgi:uncharacterized GH25 family protein
MRTVLATLALAVTCQPAKAHDFWLRPAAFKVASGQPLAVSFLVGHGREVEPWNLRWDRLHSFQSIGPDGAGTDLQADVKLAAGQTPAGATVRLEGEGTHMLVTASYHSMSTLPAAKFNDYLKLEGLTAISDARTRAGTTKGPGRELYSRRAKSLVQVGNVFSAAVTRPLGLTLEIVPQRNPYAPDGGTTLPVTVLFRGKPLAGALIDLTALDDGTERQQAQRTNASGTASFDIPRKGAWKINVIWGEPTVGRKDAEFDTVFASLTLGYADGD